MSADERTADAHWKRRDAHQRWHDRSQSHGHLVSAGTGLEARADNRTPLREMLARRLARPYETRRWVLGREPSVGRRRGHHRETSTVYRISRTKGGSPESKVAVCRSASTMPPMRAQSETRGSIGGPSHVAAKTVRTRATYAGGAVSELVSLHELLARGDWHRTS